MKYKNEPEFNIGDFVETYDDYVGVIRKVIYNRAEECFMYEIYFGLWYGTYNEIDLIKK